jgi:hypothetical protein
MKNEIKNSFSDIYLNYFPANLGGDNGEIGECFHQEISSM